MLTGIIALLLMTLLDYELLAEADGDSELARGLSAGLVLQSGVSTAAEARVLRGRRPSSRPDCCPPC